MADIIQLLPDAVANQIAAGEVVQRPASAVKELLENAIDSGASSVELILRDAGKSLIQVTDNGCGMSPTDARMSLERHATSKIRNADDLFAIQTLGFRGEALASIAAIAQVEIKSRRHEDELGTHIVIEGSQFKKQEPCACQAGTTVIIKNLFYNVPARRKFLKSIKTELRNCKEEFVRVAMVYPQVQLSMTHDNQLVHKLLSSNTKLRIVNIMGSNFEKKLLPIESDVELVKIAGFIGRPEFARKLRTEQFFFVNGRFVRSPYLGHAVENAYRELMPENFHPSFFIYITTDPKEIDINIHPTKTEVKFADEQLLYALLQSASKQAVGKFNVAPEIDFDDDQRQGIIPGVHEMPRQMPSLNLDPNYNPFSQPSNRQPFAAPEHNERELSNTRNWDKLYDSEAQNSGISQVKLSSLEPELEESISEGRDNIMVFQKRYLLTKVRSGLMMIDRKRAIERIFYERFLSQIEESPAHAQRLLFPQTLNFSEPDSVLVSELIPKLKQTGFEVEAFGRNCFIIHTVPAELDENEKLETLFQGMVDLYRSGAKVDMELKSNFAFSLARNIAIAGNKNHSQEELNRLIDMLFACNAPEISPDGKAVVRIISVDEISTFFN